MAEQRGGLDYVIKVSDQFSKTVESFNAKLEGAKKTFREFREVVSTPVKTGVEDLKEQAAGLTAVAKGLKAVKEVKRGSAQADAEQYKNLKRLSEVQLKSRDALKGYQEALKTSANIQKKNTSGTVEEAEARLAAAQAIEKSQRELLKYQTLRKNGLGGQGLTAEREAYLQLSRAIFKARVEEELREKQRKSGVNAQGRTVQQEADRQVAQAKREIKEAEAAATKAKKEGLDVDERGRVVANAKIQAERAVAETIRQANIQREKRALLDKQGIGADGLTVQQRALETYRRQIEKLAQAEANLRAKREAGIQQFVNRTAKIRAEERALEELVRAETELRLISQRDLPTGGDNRGQSLNQIQAELAAEKRIEREKQKQLRAQKEIEIRKRRGLKVSKQLKDEAKGIARETRAAGKAASSTFNLQRLLAFAGAFTAIRQAIEGFKFAVVEAVRFNATVETSTLSIAALVAASSDIPLSMDKSAGAAQRLQIATSLAQQQTAKLRQDALRTTATYEELLVAFQTAIGPGLAAGGTVDEIRQFSVQVSQAASALGVAQNQLAEEIRSIVQGTINIRTTRIAAALGLTNEDIRRAKEAGALFGFLKDEFAAFERAGEEAQGTFSGLVARLRDGFQQVAGAASEGLFDEVKAGLSDLISAFNESDDILSFRPSEEAAQILATVADALKDIVAQIREFGEGISFDDAKKGAEGLASAFKTVTALVVSFSTAVFNVVGFVAKVLDLLGPAAEYVASAAGYAVAFNATTNLLVSGWGAIQTSALATKDAVLALAGALQKIAPFFALIGRGLLVGLAVVIKGVAAAIGAVVAFLGAPIAIAIAAVTALTLGFTVFKDELLSLGSAVLNSLKRFTIRLRAWANDLASFIAGLFSGGIAKFILGEDFAASMAEASKNFKDTANSIREELDDVGKKADETRDKLARISAGEEVRTFNAFENISTFPSTIREAVSELDKLSGELEKASEKATIKLGIELQADGVDEIRQIESLRIEQQQKLEPALREQVRLEKQIEAAKGRNLAAEAKIAEISGKSRVGLIERSKVLAQVAALQERLFDLEQRRQELNLRSNILEQQGASVSAERLLALRQAQEGTAKAIRSVSQEIENLRGTEVTVFASDEEKKVFEDLINSRKQLLTLESDRKELSEEVLRIRREMASLVALEASTQAAKVIPSIRETVKERNLEIRALSRKAELIQSGASDEQIRRAEERESNQAQLRSLEDQADRLEKIRDARAKLLDQLQRAGAEEGQTAAIAREVAARDQQIQGVRKYIAVIRELIAAEAGRDRQEAGEALKREIQIQRESLRIDSVRVQGLERMNQLREAGASQEQLALERIRQQAKEQEARFQKQQGEFNRRRQDLEKLTILPGESKDDFETRKKQLQEEIDLAKQLAEAERERSRFAQEQAQAALKVALIRRDQELSGARASSEAEIDFANQITAIEQRRLGIVTSRVNNAQREYQLAQLSREEEELRLKAGIAELEAQAQLVQNEIYRLGASGKLSEEQVLRLELLRIELATLEKLTEAEKARVAAIKAQIEEQLRVQEILDEGTYGDGLELGLEQLRENFKTAAQFGKETIEDLFASLSDGFGDAIYQGIKGNKKGIGDALSGIFDSIARNFADQLGEILAQALFGDSLKNFFVGAATGGVDAGNWQGGAIPSGGTRPRMAHYINPQGYAAGGGIGGKKFKPPRGVDRRDTVPIWAAPGEFMMRLSAVKKYGVGFMHMLNSGAVDPAALPAAMYSGARRNRKIGFAEGGPIATAVSGGGTGGGGGTTVLPVMVADNANMKRLIAGGQQELRRFMAEGGR